MSKLGLVMPQRNYLETDLIQGAIVWVWGDRKCMLRTTMVTQMLKYEFVNDPMSSEGRKYLNVSNIIVKRTSFPNKGTTSEVGGIISASSKKNTVRERRMLMDRLT